MSSNLKNPVPSRYPFVIFLRKNEYKEIDNEIERLKEKFTFTYKIVKYGESEKGKPGEKIIKELNALHSEDYNVIVTIGKHWSEYAISKYFIPKMNNKWIHIQKEEIIMVDELNRKILNCFVHNLPNRKLNRPKISCFTTCFHSFEKLYRPFRSLMEQTCQNWEWVIVDDSKDDKNFQFIRENISSKDHRIRAYRKDYHSGSIGNVKNEAVSLCRGEYVLELDHDDEILFDTLDELVNGFDKHPEVGFIYMNFAECYEDKKPFTYGDSWAFHYGGYYDQYYKGNLYKVATSVDINDVTMSNIVGVPNHPRAWKKSVLMEIGNYSEALPIADDYELLLLTCLHTKMMKINKLGYIQYKNKSNNNFSLIRNGEITKLQNMISQIYYQKYNIQQFFKDKGVTEKEKRENKCINITVDTCLDKNGIEILQDELGIKEENKTRKNKKSVSFIEDSPKVEVLEL